MASDLLIPTRRGLLSGLGLLLAAPAIVRINSLMPVKTMPAREVLEDLANQREILSINLITREAVRMWKNSNAFLQNIDRQYKTLPRQKD